MQEKLHATFYDALTDETITRELTSEEIEILTNASNILVGDNA